MEAKNKNIEELLWQQAREDVLLAEPKLASIIDELNPSKKHTLFKVKYPFGSEILQDTKLCLPDKNGNIIPFENTEFSDHLKDSLSGMVQKSCVLGYNREYYTEPILDKLAKVSLFKKLISGLLSDAGIFQIQAFLTFL